MWSIMEKIPCALEKNEYSVVLGCSILYVSMRSIWFSVSFKALVSLLIFCLDDLPVVESGVLRLLILMYYYQYVSLFWLTVA